MAAWMSRSRPRAKECRQGRSTARVGDPLPELVVVAGILDEDDALSEPRLVCDLLRAIPPGSLLWAGSSMPIRDVDAGGIFSTMEPASFPLWPFVAGRRSAGGNGVATAPSCVYWLVTMCDGTRRLRGMKNGLN